MENQRHPTLEGPHSRLIVFVDNHDADLLAWIRSCTLPDEIAVQHSPTQADVQLRHGPSGLELELDTGRSIRLSENPGSLVALLMSCYHTKKAIDRHPSVTPDWNQIKNRWALQEKKRWNEDPKPSFTRLDRRQKEDLIRRLEQVPSIQALPLVLLHFPALKAYKSVAFFVHEKGLTEAIHYASDDGAPTQSFRIPVDDFQAVLHMVHKGRQKTFDRKKVETLPETIQAAFWGSFLAGDIALRRHNVIMVLSRNDFLGASDDELAFFQDLLSQLPLPLHQLLSRETSNQILHNKMEALQDYPSPLAILDERQVAVFQNNALMAQATLSDSPLSVLRTIPLDHNHNLVVYHRQEQDALNSEILHHERIALLGELLNTLKHELSNPLFGLKLSADWLVQDIHDPESIQLITEVASNIQRCQDIITNFSKIYNSNSEGLVPTDLRHSMAEALVLAKSEIKHIQRHVSFMNWNEATPIITMANPTWIIQIVFNLLVNASQAMKEAHVTTPKLNIEVSVSNASSSGPSIEIRVSDNGPGIHSSIQTQLFNPFFTTKKNGTGLGLAISRYLARRMHGDVRLLPSTGSGATFALILPAVTE